MVTFKIGTIETANFETPQEMFDDYKNRKITNIYDYQSKMLDLYLETESGKSDIALELPTGTGKTLVGLLIGEFRRRKHKEKILYLCPNNQLVYQTVKHAVEDYGISATPFVGKNINYSQKDKLAYNMAESIAVTSYSSLFNSNPYFSDADIIIFDDAHSGESYVASNWTVSVERKKDRGLYFSLLESFKDCIEVEAYERMISPNQTTDSEWFDLVPNIKLLQRNRVLKKIISDYIEKEPETNVKYPWSIIQESLDSCNVFISCDQIVIRPFIPPTLSFPPFARAKQRIYMSATLGKSGELERSFGVPKIEKLPMVKDWENKTIGRRFFMFPLASLKADKVDDMLAGIIEQVSRVLIIVNDDMTQEKLVKEISNKFNVNVFTARDFECDKTIFINSSKAVAVVANRFDGIDFPNDECRMEIILDVQSATHIQEKFLSMRMCSTVLFSERIQSRLIQALGRCTRSTTDYAAVCIIGEDLMNALFAPNRYQQFNPELQAELRFGLENSKEYIKVEDFLQLLDLFLNKRNEWSAAERYILNLRDEIIKAGSSFDEEPYKQLSKAAPHEVNAQYCIWKRDYRGALECIEMVCACLRHDSLRGYLGFWLYIAGFCAYNQYKLGDSTYEARYIDYLQRAASTTLSINWFNKLIELPDTSSIDNCYLEYVVENIEAKILSVRAKHLHVGDIFQELDDLINCIAGAKGLDFEKAYETLGQWLGYATTNPRGDAEPDPIWILNPNLCIVSENKIYDNQSKSIPVRHVRETAGHPNWIKDHYETLCLSKDVECITVFVTNATTIDSAAVIHALGIYYLNQKELCAWAGKCISVLKELILSFDAIGDVIWRDKAVKLMKQSAVTPKDYIDLIKSKELSKLRSV